MMQLTKRFIACLLCCVLCLLAACADAQPTVLQESDALQTTADAETAAESRGSDNTDDASAPQAADAITPTQADLETLCSILHGEVFFYADYDSRTDNVLDYLFNGGLLFELLNFEDLGILREGENLFRSTAYPNEGRTSGTDDPLGYFTDKCYISVDADVLNGIMENTFCNTVYKDNAISFDDDGSVNYYLHDGMYYFLWEISGMEGVQFRPGSCTAQNGRYLVAINEFYAEPGEEENAEHIVTVTVDADLREVNGERAWSIYSTKITYSKYGA